MDGRGFLARLAAPTPPPGYDLVDGVVQHLRALLNTRRGEAPTVPSYGVPDFSDVAHAFPLAIPFLQRAIKDTITEFEPRLKNVQVRHVVDDEPLMVRFEISARLTQSNRPFKLQTRVVSGGRVDIG